LQVAINAKTKNMASKDEQTNSGELLGFARRLCDVCVKAWFGQMLYVLNESGAYGSGPLRFRTRHLTPHSLRPMKT
jgi:hypothetical protein